MTRMTMIMMNAILCVVLLLGLVYVSDGKHNGLPVKRILSEWRKINKAMLDLSQPFNASNDECGVRLSPLKKNILEWHFSFTGVEGSNYEGGIYHGKIRLNPDYPQKAPTISLLTPSGRWEVKTDICLSATAHHQELWDPSWTMRTLILSLRGFMTTQPGEIGSVVSDVASQKKLAAFSRSWECPECGVNHAHLCSDGIHLTKQKLTKLYLPEDAVVLLKSRSQPKDTNLATHSPTSFIRKLFRTFPVNIKFLSGICCCLILLHRFKSSL